ncbi:KfrB domain-containing protein [Bordetella genomosp. 13]|uniref:KfrB domain-containing protein n=1 Tax=Bordetella genomosp. 13 TaxID=463040 RepID=UPI0018DFC324|nr:DUF6036 family nucleotidyltransferase [Bordetella genomosp. 13]
MRSAFESMSTMAVPQFHTDTNFAQAIKSLFHALQERLEISSQVTAYIAGGVAVHLYTAYRVSSDIDAEFSKRLLIPDDLYIEVPAPDGGIPRLVHFDKQYNSTFALMHENYVRDSLEVPLGVPNFQIRALAPVDLAVSKIARLADHDKRDIEMLVWHGLTTPEEIRHRALEALPGFVGNTRWLEMNIDNAVQLARQAEAQVLGYDLGTARAAVSGKTYTGVILSVTDSHVLQASAEGPVSHIRAALTGLDELAPGRIVEIRYPHGLVGLVQPSTGRESIIESEDQPSYRHNGPER